METPPVESTQLKGRHVMDQSGNDIGSIQDVSLDTQNWRVQGIIVSVNRDVASKLALSKPSMFGESLLTFGTERIASVGDNVILNMTSNEIAGLLVTGERP